MNRWADPHHHDVIVHMPWLKRTPLWKRIWEMFCG